MRCALLLTLVLLSCTTTEEEREVAKLKAYPPHRLPLGATIPELQKVLTGYTRHIDPVVTDRLYRIIPLKAYGLQGFASVELDPDGKARAYFWSTDREVLPEDRLGYFTQGALNELQFQSALQELTTSLGTPTTLEPYPNEKWYSWSNDSGQINLTFRKGVITFTKSKPDKP